MELATEGGPSEAEIDAAMTTFVHVFLVVTSSARAGSTIFHVGVRQQWTAH